MAKIEVLRSLARQHAAHITSRECTEYNLPPLTEADQNRLKRRYTPKVIKELVYVLGEMADGIEAADPVRIYLATTKHYSLNAFGEQGINIISDEGTIEIGLPERRHLQVLRNFGRALGSRDAQRAHNLIQGTTGIYGVAGDSGGPACNPAILSVLEQVAQETSMLFETGFPPRPKDRRICQLLERQVMGITTSLEKGDLVEAVRPAKAFSETAEQYLKRRRG